MNPVEAFAFAAFLIAFFGIITWGVVRLILDNIRRDRTRRLSDIQEQWRRIDYSITRTLGSPKNWRAMSMTWVMRADGWKGFGRSWVDDD